MLVGAGSGQRLGAGLPKAFAVLAGRTLLEHAVERLLAPGCLDVVVVVVPAGMVDRARLLLPDGVLTTAGGPTRTASVSSGVAVLHDLWGSLPDLAEQSHPGAGRAGDDVVLVHDAARCLAPPELIARVVVAVRAGHRVVVPAVPVHDTVRALHPGGGSTVVDRSSLRAVQTPQGFDRAVLEAAHAGGASALVTDDATLAEALGHPVHVVPGAEEAFKITRPLDLALAGAVLASAAPAGAVLTSTLPGAR